MTIPYYISDTERRILDQAKCRQIVEVRDYWRWRREVLAREWARRRLRDNP